MKYKDKNWKLNIKKSKLNLKTRKKIGIKIEIEIKIIENNNSLLCREE